MAKQESELRSQLMLELRTRAPMLVALRIENVRDGGVPDLSLTGAKRGTWWEFKHATPDFEDHGLQLLTCLRLDAAGYCRYVIWWESKTGIGKRTMIVTPKKVKEARDRGSWLFDPEEVTPGFDHRWLVDQMKAAHGL